MSVLVAMSETVKVEIVESDIKLESIKMEPIDIPDTISDQVSDPLATDNYDYDSIEIVHNEIMPKVETVEIPTELATASHSLELATASCSLPNKKPERWGPTYGYRTPFHMLKGPYYGRAPRDKTLKRLPSRKAAMNKTYREDTSEDSE